MLHLVSGLGQTLGMPLLRTLDPERAHGLAIKALCAGLAGSDPSPDDPRLAVHALGMSFANPIGLAAGFDKHAQAVAPLMRAGFGLVEAGTVTLRPQPGNPRPRLFRLTEDRAVINRFGFNSEGIDPFVARLDRLQRGQIRFGANIGINKDSTTPEADYAALVAALVGRADYITINISSPNTPGLVRLQARDSLTGILARVRAEVPNAPPLLVKVSPDLPDEGLEAVVEAAIAYQIGGLIVCNTTTARPAALRSPHAPEAGGLSGRPLFERSTAMLKRAAQISQGRLLLVGSGGIATGDDVLAKLRAGASLVQLYSELAFVGIRLIPRMKRELCAALERQGFPNVSAAIGADL